MSNKKFVRFVVILMLIAIVLSSVMAGVLMFL
ncbi:MULTISPECIES: stressosome-associated protein Prli42 [Listeria]|nr:MULTISPECIES: stressosome-associated protein Prli42 [Listeria]